MNRILVLTIGLLTCNLFQLSAQVNFLPGYVVSPKGDTLKGFIDYRNWEKNPDRITFREKADGTPKTYGPLDIRMFSVATDQYFGAVVKVEDSPDEVGKLTYSAEYAIRTDTAFLRVLISGSKSLYLYDERGGKRHYYIGEGSGFDLLLYKKYVRDSENGKVITEVKTFRGKLKTYLGECDGVNKLLPRASYERKSLEKIFTAYYACSGTKAGFEKKVDRQESEIGIIAGVTLTTLTLDADQKQIMMATDYPRSTGFTAGICYNLPLLRNLGRISLNTELMYTSYQAEGKYSNYNNATWYQYTETSFKYSHLKLNVMPRIKFPMGATFLFVNAGFSLGGAIQEDQYWHYTNVFGSSTNEKEGKAFEKTQSFEFGYLGGLGLSYNRFSLEARYARTGGMVSTFGVASDVSRVFFLVGYRIK